MISQRFGLRLALPFVLSLTVIFAVACGGGNTAGTTVVQAAQPADPTPVTSKWAETFPAATAQPVAETAALGTAGAFAVLGGSTVTNTGSTVIVGGVGSSPGLAITGFPPGLVSGGTIHKGDAVASQAQLDVTAAYSNLTGRACDFDLTGQDLGGKTLTQGVYCFSSSAQLTGALQLDAQGSADAVFIFKIGSTLTTASNSSVMVINSGNDCRVFWQVGSSATLGVGTSFVGNILALTSITMTTGAIVSGRALAQNGAVTLDTNGVSIVACSALPPPPVETCNKTLCGTACIDVASDEANCGACGNSCDTGVECVNGACALPPPPVCNGGVACGENACVQLSSDANNCGACGNSCAANSQCVCGACTIVCNNGTLCNGACADFTSDPNNCGACGNACGVGGQCNQGTCAAICTGDILCGGAYIDVKSDKNNCGTCGNVCAHVCSAGVCEPDLCP